MRDDVIHYSLTTVFAKYILTSWHLTSRLPATKLHPKFCYDCVIQRTSLIVETLNATYTARTPNRLVQSTYYLFDISIRAFSSSTTFQTRSTCLIRTRYVIKFFNKNNIINHNKNVAHGAPFSGGFLHPTLGKYFFGCIKSFRG